MSAKVHYAGELRYAHGELVTQILPGYAACCSGDRAIAIRAKFQNTYLRERVTCKSCLRRLASHIAYANSGHVRARRVCGCKTLGCTGCGEFP